MNALCFSTPFGRMKICEENGVVSSLRFVPPEEKAETSSPLLLRANKLLSAYFAGERVLFDLPVVLPGTPFAKKVAEEMMKIPYGETLSYGDLAVRCGCPGGARAVGNVCRTNPVLLLIPCHRVVASSGGLGGYSGGRGCGGGQKEGLALKRALLLLENPAFGR